MIQTPVLQYAVHKRFIFLKFPLYLSLYNLRLLTEFEPSLKIVMFMKTIPYNTTKRKDKLLGNTVHLQVTLQLSRYNVDPQKYLFKHCYSMQEREQMT